jgi:hypothetical protein
VAYDSGGKHRPHVVARNTALQAAQQGADGLRQTTSSLASDTRSRIKELLGGKVTSRAELIGDVASSPKRAAGDLEPECAWLTASLLVGAFAASPAAVEVAGFETAPGTIAY